MASSLLTKHGTSILSAWAKSKYNALIYHPDWSAQPSAQTLGLEFFNVEITICGHKDGLMRDRKVLPTLSTQAFGLQPKAIMCRIWNCL